MTTPGVLATTVDLIEVWWVAATERGTGTGIAGVLPGWSWRSTELVHWFSIPNISRGQAPSDNKQTHLLVSMWPAAGGGNVGTGVSEVTGFGAPVTPRDANKASVGSTEDGLDVPPSPG